MEEKLAKLYAARNMFESLGLHESKEHVKSIETAEMEYLRTCFFPKLKEFIEINLVNFKGEFSCEIERDKEGLVEIMNIKNQSVSKKKAMRKTEQRRELIEEVKAVAKKINGGYKVNGTELAQALGTGWSYKTTTVIADSGKPYKKCTIQKNDVDIIGIGAVNSNLRYK